LYTVFYYSSGTFVPPLQKLQGFEIYCVFAFKQRHLGLWPSSYVAFREAGLIPGTGVKLKPQFWISVGGKSLSRSPVVLKSNGL
jgi:hypothetical protein